MVYHYNDVIMSAMKSQITSFTTFHFTIYSRADQSKHQSAASLAFVRRFHRWPGSNNGMSPGRHQAIIWAKDEILLIWPLGTNFSEMLIEIHTFPFTKVFVKISSAKKWRPFCLTVKWYFLLHECCWGLSTRLIYTTRLPNYTLQYSVNTDTMNSKSIIHQALMLRLFKFVNVNSCCSHYA